jgi:hypothetical protein
MHHFFEVVGNTLLIINLAGWLWSAWCWLSRWLRKVR